MILLSALGSTIKREGGQRAKGGGGGAFDVENSDMFPQVPRSSARFAAKRIYLIAGSADLDRVPALVRSHMNCLIPFERTIGTNNSKNEPSPKTICK